MTTPIDPTDGKAILKVLADTWFAEGVVGRTPANRAGALAVARAVVPEGYVAVPMAEIEAMIVDITESPWWDSTEDAGETLYAVRDKLNSLLPTESEATR